MSAAYAAQFDRAGEVPIGDISSGYPLVLDLDGTLLRTDLLLEAMLHYVRTRPLRLFQLLLWAFRGPAHLKHQVALRSELAVDLLPINDALVAYARTEAARGRTVIVATAASENLAKRVCARFGFIADVIGSCDRTNLKGPRKATMLAARFPDGYVYAGDAAPDLAVWRQARFGVFAGHSASLLRRASNLTAFEADFQRKRPTPDVWVRALRIHQWAKNGLLFLPLMLAGNLLDVQGWIACAIGFVAMGCIASATYLVNDLVDLEADRQHWTKRNRPIASGAISIPQAVGASALLLPTGLTLSLVAGGLDTLAIALLYCVMTSSYSLYLKRVPLLDVTMLAGLFTLRLAVGAAIADVVLSSWLMVFSMFLFLSLGLSKRSTEISRKAAAGGNCETVHGRGYVHADAPLVIGLGLSSAMAALVIMVLYLIEEAFSDAIYGLPQLLWGVPVIIGLWLGRIWLLSGRGVLNDDPVAFAVGDRTSILLGIGVMACFAGAAIGG